MNFLEQQKINDVAMMILAECPPYALDNNESVERWFINICKKMQFTPDHHPQLKTKLMYAWLSDIKGIDIFNMEILEK